MKRHKYILIALIILFIPFYVYAMDWEKANQITVAWDPVTGLEDGGVISETDVIKYNVYLVDSKNLEDIALLTEIPILETQFTATFTEEGFFYLGAQTVRLNDAGEELATSVIVWSNDPLAVQDGKVFGVKFFNHPSPPSKLRLN